jgi:hypothetical protein
VKYCLGKQTVIQKEVIMRDKFSMISVAIAVAVISVSVTRTPAQAPVPSALTTPPLKTVALKTAWGDPDLQGIWTSDSDTPLQRPARYANQEFFSPAERAELDKARTDVLARADASRDKGDARDVAGAYNSQFVTFKRTGARTSLIVDPTDGRIPPRTAEAQKIAAAERDFRLALLQATDTCMAKDAACSGGGSKRCDQRQLFCRVWPTLEPDHADPGHRRERLPLGDLGPRRRDDRPPRQRLDRSGLQLEDHQSRRGHRPAEPAHHRVR